MPYVHKFRKVFNNQLESYGRVATRVARGALGAAAGGAALGIRDASRARVAAALSPRTIGAPSSGPLTGQFDYKTDY